MLFSKNYYNKYFSYTKYLLILLLFWVSINTGSKYVEINNINWHLTNNTLNFIRSILPYLILIYFFIFETKKHNFRLFNFDIFFKLFFLYGLLQISGLIYKFDDFYESYWIVCLFSVLIFYNLIEKKNDKELLDFIFLINLVLILFIFLIFIFVTFKENILSKALLYHSSAFNIIYNTEQLPRSSGLSRMALILFIFVNSLYFSKKLNRKINIYLIIINITFVSIIFLLQSRGALLSCTFITLATIIFYKFKHIIKYFLIIFFSSTLIFLSYPNFKNFVIEKYGQKKSASENTNIKFKKFEINIRNDLLFLKQQDITNHYLSFIEGYIENNRYKSYNEITSITNNRIEAWNFLLQIFFKNNLDDRMKSNLINSGYDIEKFKKIKKRNLVTGFGPQADRHILYNKSKLDESPTILGPFGYNASNGIVYSLICSGLLGMICFIIINLIIFFKIIKLLIYHFKISNLNSEPFLISSIFSILFLQMRLLFENSYSVFGVDLLILISSYLIIDYKYKKIKS